MAQDALVFIGIASNSGDRPGNLRTAVKFLGNFLGHLIRSPVYLTAPGSLDGAPPQLSMVARGFTERTPAELLDRLQEIETMIGRAPSHGSDDMVIDLDILYFANQIINNERLQTPHPRLRERGDVLRALNDLSPNWRDPRDNRKISELMAEHVTGAAAHLKLGGLVHLCDEAA